MLWYADDRRSARVLVTHPNPANARKGGGKTRTSSTAGGMQFVRHSLRFLQLWCIASQVSYSRPSKALKALKHMMQNQTACHLRVTHRSNKLSECKRVSEGSVTDLLMEYESTYVTFESSGVYNRSPNRCSHL